MKKYKGSPAHDSGLLAAAQAVEHEELGREDAVSLSQETLEEEKAIPPSALGRRAPGRLSSPGPGIPLVSLGAILENAGKLSPQGEFCSAHVAMQVNRFTDIRVIGRHSSADQPCTRRPVVRQR
jgi:hypothetical protein